MGFTTNLKVSAASAMLSSFTGVLTFKANELGNCIKSLYTVHVEPLSLETSILDSPKVVCEAIAP